METFLENPGVSKLSGNLSKGRCQRPERTMPVLVLVIRVSLTLTMMIDGRVRNSDKYESDDSSNCQMTMMIVGRVRNNDKYESDDSAMSRNWNWKIRSLCHCLLQHMIMMNIVVGKMLMVVMTDMLLQIGLHQGHHLVALIISVVLKQRSVFEMTLSEIVFKLVGITLRIVAMIDSKKSALKIIVVDQIILKSLIMEIILKSSILEVIPPTKIISEAVRIISKKAITKATRRIIPDLSLIKHFVIMIPITSLKEDLQVPEECQVVMMNLLLTMINGL
jgi:hypothetical protein